MRRFLSLFDGLELFYYLLVVVGGIACIGYAGFNWAAHWINTGEYLTLAIASLVTFVLAVAAALRVPIALFVFFGVAAVVGTAFLTGYGGMFIP